MIFNFMIQVFDDLFAHDFLVDIHKECCELGWQYGNIANRYQYPKNSMLCKGSHLFFGCNLFWNNSKFNVTNRTPFKIMEVLEFFIGEVISEEDLTLSSISGNLQVYSQDGTPHQDLYVGNGRDRTILFYPHYEWKEEWGGALEILDNNGNVIDSYFPKPGRIVYFDSTILHRGKAPLIPNIGRMSIAYRMIKN